MANLTYAVVQSGGKQYKVSPGQEVVVDKLGVGEGDSVELEQVLLVAEGDRVVTGSPFVEGAKVIAKSLGEEKGKKIIVFKYKPKVRYSKKTGHRQVYTKLAIENIVTGQGAGDGTQKGRRHRPKQQG
ncbi:MAG: 50S ribosomal protein L21 [Chloroflexota bacterium]